MGLPNCYNFAAYDMATKFSWVNGQPGMGAVEPVSSGLTSLTDGLSAARERSDKGIDVLAVGWRGQASDVARESLTGTTQGMAGTATVTENASARLTDYGHSFEAMRRQIAFDDPDRYSAWQHFVDRSSEVWSDFAGSADHVTVAERNQANDELANRALQMHSVETSMADDRFVTATGPAAAPGSPGSPGAPAGNGGGTGGPAPVGPVPGGPDPLPRPDTTGPSRVQPPGVPPPGAPDGPVVSAPPGTPGGPTVPGPPNATAPPAPRPGDPAPDPPGPNAPAPDDRAPGSPGTRTPGPNQPAPVAPRPDTVAPAGPDVGDPGPPGGGGPGANRITAPEPGVPLDRPAPGGPLPGPRFPGTPDRSSPGGRFGQDVAQRTLVPRTPYPGGNGPGGTGPLGERTPGGTGAHGERTPGGGPGGRGAGAGGAGAWGTEPRTPGGRTGAPSESWAAPRTSAERGAGAGGYGPMAGGAGMRGGEQDHRNRYVVPTDEVFDVRVAATDAVLGPEEEDHRCAP